MSVHWRDACWPEAQLGPGLFDLARHVGAVADGQALPAGLSLAPPATPAEQADWLTWAGEQLGAQLDAVQCALPDTQATLRHAGPAVLRLQHEGQTLFAMLVGTAGRQARLLTPAGLVVGVALADLRDALCQRWEAPLAPELQQLLALAQVPARRRTRVHRSLLAERLGRQTLQGMWILRPPAEAPLARQAAPMKLARRLLVFAGLLVLAYALELLGWQLIGGAALDGRLDHGWLWAWVLLVLTLVPLQAGAGWLQTGVTLDIGRLIKQRLLAGALRLNLDAVRQRGAGQWLSRVMESQALESQALAGALGVLVAIIELGFAAWVLSQGAWPLGHLAMLAAWLLLTGLLAWRLARRQAHWTEQRLSLTHDLIEGMVGHRTRLAQESALRRDADEDRAAASYLQASARLDQAIVPLAGAMPGGWVLVALAGLVPAMVGTGAAHAASSWAISLGGILFAHRALSGLSGSLSSLAGARIAWRQVADLLQAGTQAGQPGPYIGQASRQALSQRPAQAPALLDAHGLGYRYRPTLEPVLRGASISLQPDQKVLLEGPSGGGKSTLAAILAGLRQPDAGSLMLAGLDRPTLGDSWHALVTEAPQFHENHVLTGTLAFNLLMGRSAGEAAHDALMAEAQSLCEELGLGDLLARMPAGLHQRVGETGWQLSHGERSRVFLARALLQGAPLTILDETFGALDPATLRLCMQAVLRRTRTLVVIAHP